MPKKKSPDPEVAPPDNAPLQGEAQDRVEAALKLKLLEKERELDGLKPELEKAKIMADLTGLGKHRQKFYRHDDQYKKLEAERVRLSKQLAAESAESLSKSKSRWSELGIPAWMVKNFVKVWQKSYEKLVDWQATVFLIIVIVIVIGLLYSVKPEWVNKILQWLKGLKELFNDFGTGTFLS